MDSEDGSQNHDASLCPLYHHAIELIGRRWSGAIVEVMRGGVVRFSDLRGGVPGLSDRMLSERLKELESEGIVVRQVIPETPVRVEYRLTPKGMALGEVLDAVATWAHDWLRGAPPPEDHCIEPAPESAPERLPGPPSPGGA